MRDQILIFVFWAVIFALACSVGALMNGCAMTYPNEDQLQVRIVERKIIGYRMDGNMLVLALEDGNTMRVYPTKIGSAEPETDVDLTVEFDR